MVFKFCLTFSVPEKLINSIFEKPIISQILNINNLKTTSAKSIKLHTFRKLIEYAKRYCKGNVYSYRYRDTAFRIQVGIILYLKAATGGVLEEQMFLEILQYSRENTCGRVYFLIKLQSSACNFIKKETLAQVFSCEFCEISQNNFFTEHFRTTVCISNRFSIVIKEVNQIRNSMVCVV